MPPRRRALTDHERADWAAFVRTIRQLPGQAVATDADSAAEPIARPATTPRPHQETPRVLSRPSSSPLSIGLRPGGVDAATWHRFQAGRLAPARRLDLHGQTVQSAYHMVQDFIRRAHRDHVHCVEVITGRGAQGNGVLRRELPLWLNMSELRPLLLALSHPRPGNDGAVRLLLRRIR